MKRTTRLHAWGLGCLAVLLLGASSCGGRTDTTEVPAGADSPSADSSVAAEPPPASDEDEASTFRPTPDLRVSARQVDGVWVFTNVVEDSADALHVGPVSISNGCLFVGADIVVWHERRLDEVREYIEAVRRGSPPDVTLGGGEGILAPVIEMNCGVQPVWFTN
jgi:hypothetical protein